MRESDLKERDRDLINNWYIASLSSELAASGEKPFECVIYDTKLVLFRDENKNPVCMINKCLHRHSELGESEVVNGQLMCPYHGWTYNKEGLVTAIPSEGPEMVKGKRCQKTFATKELD